MIITSVRWVGLLIATGLFGLSNASTARAETDLERGRYLMNGVVACGNCHTPQTPDGPNNALELAGGFPIVMPGVFTAYAPNITPDVETGLGGWSDEDIIRAIREGVRPDGSIIGPPMPIEVYRGLSDRDARDRGLSTVGSGGQAGDTAVRILVPLAAELWSAGRDGSRGRTQ